MQAFGMLLLAAATAGDGFGYSDPGVGLKKWLRPHVVTSANAPGPPPYTANSAGMAGPQGAGRRFASTRSQVYFLDPNGMKIGWQTGGGPNGEKVYLPAQLTVPARYNFSQGFIYRLKLTDIPGRAGAALYPTIEVAPTTPGTDAYLAHNAIPIQFTPEDFDQVLDGGNFVTKVIYLPDPKFQELAVSGVETLVSTRLEPGIDPILEADKRGTILLIVRLGAIDLEMPGGGSILGGATTGPAGGAMSGGHDSVVGPGVVELPPGALPPGVTPSVPAGQGTVILDPAPAAAAPAAPVVPVTPSTPASPPAPAVNPSGGEATALAPADLAPPASGTSAETPNLAPEPPAEAAPAPAAKP
ncbi:MAG: hypothetical protein ACLQGP_13745 [Isosphaeraceae bacterium]